MSNSTSFVDAGTVGIRPPHYSLPDATHVGAVTLAVSNLDRSIAFYQGVIGLSILQQEHASADLGIGTTVLVKLRQMPGVQPIGRRTRLGLYHTAFLLPSRSSLGSFLQHLHRNKIPYGAGDHIYSEALYLVDPDGLSVEVYADRPRNTWKTSGQELLSATNPVDIAGVIAVSDGEWKGAPAGTTIGHVHLYIGDLEKAARFYHQAVGFTVMTWSYSGALFISAGGYHHHVGLNVWAAGSPVAGPGDARLLSWELVVPNTDEIEAIQKNLARLGWDFTRNDDSSLTATDPWGITVHIVAA